MTTLNVNVKLKPARHPDPTCVHFTWVKDINTTFEDSVNTLRRRRLVPNGRGTILEPGCLVMPSTSRHAYIGIRVENRYRVGIKRQIGQFDSLVIVVIHQPGYT